jgi:S1-C subfamily serine protease
MHTAKSVAGAGVLLMLAAAWPMTAAAQDGAAAGRQVLEAHQEAVVTVRLVIKISMGGRGDTESTQEITGTVVHPSGLTVVALSETDPSTLFRNMMGAFGDQFQMDSSVTDVQIMLADGTELPGEFVLRDVDLDLAYLRPRETPAQPLSHVDLSAGAQAQVLEQLVALSRLGRVANRVSTASFEHVQGVVERPRMFYVLGREATQASLGSPVFKLSGEPVGVVVLRTIRGTGGGGGLMGMMMGGMEDMMLPILLPASDIARHIEQALQQPAETQEPPPPAESDEAPQPAESAEPAEPADP